VHDRLAEIEVAIEPLERRPDVANLEVAEAVPMKATLLKMNPPSEQAHVVVRGTSASFIQEIVSGKHRLRADEPVGAGGSNRCRD
jgi:hypothetical protein